MTTTESPGSPSPAFLDIVRNWFTRRAMIFKVIGLALLGLLLFIPLNMVESTLSERQMRYESTVQSIAQSWGGRQRVGGPALVVPFLYTVITRERGADGREVKMEREQQGEATFLPDQLRIEGEVTPSIRRRGIYETPVYTARLKISGQFAAPDFSGNTRAGVRPLWEQARLCFIISDLRGTQDDLTLQWGAEKLPVQPGARWARTDSGIHVPVKLAANEGREFSLELALNGSDDLVFIPYGRQTEVQLHSSWQSPSFTGAYLPSQRTVDAKGFDAQWRVSFYGRTFPQQWIEGTEGQPTVAKMEESSFGVSLLQPVNRYRTVERAIKYGVLFITLVFTTLFLFEAVTRVPLSALNYLLVGAALCLFYLGVLALAEFIAFAAAYALSAAVSTLLITAYARRILQSTRRAWLLAGMLGGVYGYLYFVLQMEDFALLAGTAALFVVLGAVMWATRHLTPRKVPAEA